jgi:BASS family bile acid:Na+ symporter
LAKGNVALSITLTTVSTTLAVVATPLLTWLYVGRQVPVPVMDMLLSILKIVILPVALGVAANSCGGKVIRRFQHVFPMVSVLAIVLIIAIIVALNRNHLDNLAASVGVSVAVVLHNLMGLSIGYLLPYWMGFRERERRTLAIEVGMQNSGLGVALAVQYFSAVAALPGALFSIWHNLSGSLLAGYWSRTSDRETDSKSIHRPPC